MHSVWGSELHAIQMAIEIVDPTPDSYVSSVDLIRGLLITSNQRRSLKIQWIKAYAGIEGNELLTLEPRVLIINLKYQSTHSVCRRFVVISLSIIKSIGGNTGSRNLTGVGQFLRSVRGMSLDPVRWGLTGKWK